ncbi:TIGR03087 family PEP-CTERM/XrtA system glycosyltransferase [Thioalkalivibrio thiocyanoxidans]|uniref:TIGR03087 family PEP-CTERM/XrtA system glycosyltransferase n=1 Tax=Thioalkalivibrio thiocyanoxidans TaxID=152475 RepID=UPI000378D0EC|nr:TIGR03087 family PEP-CTERM/XrtA system glycosyltransferase [Thioalkalivibrio thiocyanoxidans]
MDAILYLTHRIPWPPNKGDKIRSHHILRYLAQRYRVHLGTFIDDPDDAVYVEELERCCESVCVRPLSPGRAKWRALRGLLTQEPLTLPWYRDAALQRWVDQVLEQQDITRALVFSSAMAQYLPHRANLPRVVDFVDVDSDKWTQYAASKAWPMSAIYRREGRQLLRYERQVAARSEASLFVSPDEATAFRALAPESADRVHALNNGVDAAYFDPQKLPKKGPYPDHVRPIVFSGAMDYWPNVEAVVWFAESVLPRIRRECPDVRFYIVGCRPSPDVRELERQPGVEVVGPVEDMRPWVGSAAVSVAPLRIARGVQNKVLEAMALARPVVASPQALEGITAARNDEVIEAETDPEVFARAVLRCLEQPEPEMAASARRRITTDYDWGRNLARLHDYLESGLAPEGEAIASRGDA